MQLEKVFEYEYDCYFDEQSSLITYYKGVHCWVQADRWVYYPEHVATVDKLLAGWESGEIELPQEFSNENQYPLTMYYVNHDGLQGSSPMSLYEFCILVLGRRFVDVPKPLRATAFQCDDDGNLTGAIDCECSDEESTLTEKNYKIIKREFKALKQEVKKHYGNIDFYLHLVGGEVKGSEMEFLEERTSSKETFRSPLLNPAHG